MLFAVEGGGFFSSSASGYSKGLTLLLLGQKNEEKPMRVTPWNQYQLVDQETDPDLQLASAKNRPVRGCASFACFGRAAAGLESPSPLKVGPTQTREVQPGPPVFDESKDPKTSPGCVDDGDRSKRIVSLRSSLKKTNSAPIASTGSRGGDRKPEHETSCEKSNDVACQTQRRKVQWTDTTGGDLFEIREFEMSEVGSDDDFDHVSERTCACRIM
ncbi:uncharacterized protein LOC105159385 [Sesamum indicum]|uniref:Uncharacterized protein LOC105159385 n=1 Tax=Sesamum indicum TaxID=4182 RepID=A0A6I9T380_SESIN|nr:uncharacterized protein LOC105159385 [Sesamum indicum]XP_011074735.1 uncharacterized protein LOC105159385 [Sesamum indicum]